jgi:isopenicillin N synthase-like dioxygenase
MIPRIDFQKMIAGDAETLETIAYGARDVGFLTLENTPISGEAVQELIALYRRFFKMDDAAKAAVDMARTGANRGWGASKSEQVDPKANPDYKQVFDCGLPVPDGDPMAHLPVYAPNLWPEAPEGFQETVEQYFAQARAVSLALLAAIARAIGKDGDYFADKFDRPMALLRANFYPPRPDWAGEKDFGIAAHTDYGCLTLLATDGQAGLEVEMRDGSWLPVAVEPGVFVINFGEMLEMWSEGGVKATLHRVTGGAEERISIPLFFNPNYDANVAPAGSDQVIRAGDHLSRRYAETYLHMKTA